MFFLGMVYRPTSESCWTPSDFDECRERRLYTRGWEFGQDQAVVLPVVIHSMAALFVGFFKKPHWVSFLLSCPELLHPSLLEEVLTLLAFTQSEERYPLLSVLVFLPHFQAETWARVLEHSPLSYHQPDRCPVPAPWSLLWSEDDLLEAFMDRHFRDLSGRAVYHLRDDLLMTLRNFYEIIEDCMQSFERETLTHLKLRVLQRRSQREVQIPWRVGLPLPPGEEMEEDLPEVPEHWTNAIFYLSDEEWEGLDENDMPAKTDLDEVLWWRRLGIILISLHVAVMGWFALT